MSLRSMPAASVVLALALLSLGAWSQEAASPSAKPSAATLQHDIERCKARANLEQCYDAIRWNPGDPELLVALGDALLRANRTADAIRWNPSDPELLAALGDALARANRTADAIRTYRRAAALAPGNRSLAAKISAAEAKLSSTRAPATASAHAADPASAKRYSNAAPEAQSH
jgi:cytochrome c-type biogenesis protein CcmH/NrfG